MALRNVVRHRRRSALALAAIASGVAALILARGFIDWNLWQYRESAIKSQFGHIRVHRAGYGESGLSDPFAFLMPDQDPEREVIKSAAHVRILAPRLFLTGLASRGELTLSFVGEGVDPLSEAELSQALLIVEGTNLSVDDSKGIIVGQGLADSLGARIGDSLVLLATTRSGGLNGVEVHVRGIFSSVTKAYDDAALRLPISTAQELLRVSGAHAWVLLLEDTIYTEEVLETLRRSADSGVFEFAPWWQFADFYNKSAALLSKQVGVVRLIIALLIILSISNTLMMSVMERTSEIGTSMALGIPRAKILSQFVVEGVLLGIIGGSAGLILGTVLAKIISGIGIPIAPPPGMTRGYLSEVQVTLPLLVDAFVLALLTTLLASLYPAWKASRLNIVDALRRNG